MRLLLHHPVLAALVLVAFSGPVISHESSGQSPEFQQQRAILTPVLGNYPDASIALSTNTTVTPDAVPAMTTSINVSTSTNFKGRLEGNPATGVVRVTDAHPAGIYTLTIRAFDGNGNNVTKSFTLTVTIPVTCTPVTFAAAASFATGSSPRAIAVGDFNRDGAQDVVVSNYNSGNVSVLLGDGPAHFAAPANYGTGSNPEQIGVGDFNGDGNQDLVVANRGSGNLSVLLGDGAGHFTGPTSFGDGPSSVAVGDFNGDGKQDLAMTRSRLTVINNVSILLGNGAGGFAAPVDFAAGSGAVSIAVGDFNGDGKQDLAVVNSQSNNVSILRGDGTGNFSSAVNFATGLHPTGVVVGDFNNDQKQDLAVVNYDSGDVSILLGDGNGMFIGPSDVVGGDGPSSVAVGDFNGDGNQDLAVANLDSSNVSILLGRGDGGFRDPMNFNAGVAPFAVAVGDFNGDGKQDLVLPDFLSGSDKIWILKRECSAVSRKIHGGFGIFDIDLPLTGSQGIECRTGGHTNDHTIVMRFGAAISVNGNPQAQVISGIGMVGTDGMSNGGMVTVSGSAVAIPLTNVANAQQITVALNGVNGSTNFLIPMKLLIGDANGNGHVNATDVAQTKSRIGQAVITTNFRSDVNANGTINATDAALVKSRIGTGVP